ncbi:MAG: hypothetical protein D6768_13120 [Chloroflexi bacterium]|nr:MAG: hypothetical protein D6768_13120 [Chloroflexota bacterium]
MHANAFDPTAPGRMLRAATGSDVREAFNYVQSPEYGLERTGPYSNPIMSAGFDSNTGSK